MPYCIADWQAVLGSASERSATADRRLRISSRLATWTSPNSNSIEAEQQCCTFFSFALTIDQCGIVVEVYVPEGAAEIVDTVFGKAS